MAPLTDELTEANAALLSDYERHLVSERDLSPHSVRAYLGDVSNLLEHLQRLGCTGLVDADLRSLRSWLAKQQTLGRSRTTLARRATAARVFTAWAFATGRTPRDAGAQLGSPKPHRSLPEALTTADARALLDQAGTLAAENGPLGLRDAAVLELLYATGMRVGELTNLDIDDVDHERRVVRVFCK